MSTFKHSIKLGKNWALASRQGLTLAKEPQAWTANLPVPPRSSTLYTQRWVRDHRDPLVVPMPVCTESGAARPLHPTTRIKYVFSPIAVDARPITLPHRQCLRMKDLSLCLFNTEAEEEAICFDGKVPNTRCLEGITETCESECAFHPNPSPGTKTSLPQRLHSCT